MEGAKAYRDRAAVILTDILYYVGGDTASIFRIFDKKEALSRREQRGWTGARAKARPPRSGGGFCPSRREAARREQGKRDNEEALSRREQRGKAKEGV